MFGDWPGPDGEDAPVSLNVPAAVGVVVFGLLAAVGLFVLPTLRAQGLGFRAAFLVVAVVEFVAAVGAGLSAFYLFSERELE